MADEPKLTAKQKAFVDEYLIDLNATQAAMRAGYSEKTAGRIGQQNLQKLVIAQSIAKAMQERSEVTKIDAAWVLTEAAKSYAINAKTRFDQNGNEEQTNAAAAKGFLELCGKHVGVQAFKEKLELSGEVSIKRIERAIVEVKK